MVEVKRDAQYHSAGYVVAPATHQLSQEGSAVEVEAKVFDLIVLLVANHERALGKQEIIEALWGRRPITDAALSQLIYKARRACGDDGDRQAVIRTIYGHGLQWIAPVEVVVPATAASSVSAGSVVANPAAFGSGNASRNAPQTPRPRPRWRWAALAAVVLVASGGLAWWLVAGRVAGTAPTVPRIAILPVENATGQPGLDWTGRGLPGLIASLLAGPEYLDVVEPAEIAKAWALTPPKGTTRSDHVRFVTGATITVEGRLRKPADKLYELALHVHAGDGHRPTEIVVTDADPGSLGASAAQRLLRAIGRVSMQIDGDGETPRDDYLMETFARGLEASLRGDWQAALPHFTLVSRGEREFLPARYRLGQAQARTDQQEDAQATLQEVIRDASQNARPDLVARSYAELAHLATARHAYLDALELLDRARSSAAQSDSPQISASLALSSARANARLDRVDAAERNLQQARQLVDRHDLRQLRPDLHNVEIFVADGRSDYVALEAAARGSLAANEAIGNERGAMGALFNIGYGLENQGRSDAALPLFARAWQWGRKHQDYPMQSIAGYYIAATLQDRDLDERSDEISAVLLEQARRAGDASTQRLMLQMQAGSLWRSGDDAGVLRLCREASRLADARNDPHGALYTWTAEAFVALTRDPSSLADLARRGDAVAAGQDDPAPFQFQLNLLHALVAAANGDHARLRSALATADRLATRSGDRGELRQVSLRIALAVSDAAAAELALADFDAIASTSTTELRLVEHWAGIHGREDLARQASLRRSALRQSALEALGDARLPGTDAASTES